MNADSTNVNLIAQDSMMTGLSLALIVSPLSFIKQHPHVLEAAAAAAKEDSQLAAETIPILTSIEDAIFDLFKYNDRDYIDISKFIKALRSSGILITDPRLRQLYDELCKRGLAHDGGVINYDATRTMLVSQPPNVDDEDVNCALDRETFRLVLRNSIVLVTKALQNQLVIPEWASFCDKIGEIVTQVSKIDSGHVATYIPQLARVDPTHFGVAVCTVSGQRHAWGNSRASFCMQSISKPFTYAVALNDLGAELVHNFIGCEPSGRLFNEICLDYNNKPHNPMVNAGAIICASLLNPKGSLADRFDYLVNRFQALCGSDYIGYSNATYQSEKATADRNRSLAYYMREHGCFPKGVDLDQTLDFYFQLCSIEVNAESCAIMAATLANGGICPITDERVLTNDSCRHTLSLMYSCGMYDYSGMFAFKVGLPAKSGVSGGMILVVPNVCGFCIFSPPLDKLGNTVRGVRFCEELVKVFSLHNYDNLLHHDKARRDPRRRTAEGDRERLMQLLFAAKYGDLNAVKSFCLQGVDLLAADYDGRTALHVAAAEGHKHICQFIVNRNPECARLLDRWGHLPLDDARTFNHNECIELFDKLSSTSDKRIDDEPNK